MRYERDFNEFNTFSTKPNTLELSSTLSDVGRHPTYIGPTTGNSNGGL